MKKSKLLKLALLLCVMAALLTVGIFGALNLEKITAYRNYDIDIKYDGVSQVMTDVNGTRVYPITIDGTTYLPIRAVSNMMGVNVLWDQASYSVLLGKTGIAQDFIESLAPYAAESGFSHYANAAGKTTTIAGKSYSHWIRMGNYDDRGFYDLGGLYDTLSFDAYSEYDCKVQFFGDNGVLLETVELAAYQLPKTCTVDVTGVTQLTMTFCGDTFWAECFLLNMFIQ